MDVPTATGLAEALLDYTTQVRRNDSLAGILKDTVNRKLLPAVRTTDAGVFLETAAGRSDVETGILCGTLLLRAGALNDSTLAESVGRGLLASSLSLADEKGYLPAGLVLAGRRVASREGTLAPETIYPLLPLPRYVPRETSLASQLGPGAWLWTAAHVVSATGSAGEASFTFGFPSGVPFHVIIQGIAPFELLKLHKIPWHSDPTYFKYSDGWTYDARSRTLFMKITGQVRPGDDRHFVLSRDGRRALRRPASGDAPRRAAAPGRACTPRFPAPAVSSAFPARTGSPR